MATRNHREQSAACASRAIEVPAGATDLRLSMTGGTGDGDMYVRYAQVPSGEAYDHAPRLDGNAEQVAIPAPQAGTHYVVIHGFGAFAGVGVPSPLARSPVQRQARRALARCSSRERRSRRRVRAPPVRYRRAAVRLQPPRPGPRSNCSRP